MRKRIYYEINEQSARSAHEMMSFRDYKEGSLTVEYKGYVDEAYDLADKVAESRPEEADRVYGIADRYSKKMAANLNDRSRIGCMCPSVMICGPANFPVRKKEKQNAASDRNYQEFQEIQKMLSRIRSIGNGKSIIKSGDVDAVERLEKKLNGLKELQEKMKAANAYYRKNKALDGCPVLTQEQIDNLKEKMQKDWHYEDKPFATYQLSNNNAEIHRIEGRLKKLRAAKTEGNTESENTYFRTVENAEIMRLQLFFDDKPESNVRDVLKKNGFRWSRKNNCWQRQLTDNARYSLERVEKELEELATCLCNTCTFVSSDNEEPYL